MTVNELLVEMMKLTLSGKGDCRVQFQQGYECADINEVDTDNSYNVVNLKI